MRPHHAALLAAAPLLVLATGACSRQSPEGQGNSNPGAIPENQGMGAGGPGVGDNAPGASEGANIERTTAHPTSTPGGAADYPATGKP